MLFKRGLIVGALVAVGVVQGMAGPAQVEAAAKKAVIVLVNSISLDDIDGPRTPFLGRLIDEGAVGLLSPRTAGTTATIFRSYLSLGAGTRSQGNDQAALGFNIDERW
ncbi:MAG: hypothetical protein ACE5E0_00855 [Terriglobia bacterium]